MSNVIIPAWREVLSEAEWLKLREKGIGGSDSGTIVGTNAYGSAYQLWSEKTHTTERTFEGNDATKWGHRLENVIAEAYAEDYNKAIVEWPVFVWSSDPDLPFMYANLDFVEVVPSEQFPAGKVTVWKSIEIPEGIIDIVECKTTGIATMGNGKKWENGKVPDSYLCQGYHYGIVIATLHLDLALKHVTFACLAPPNGLIVRTMGTRSDDMIAWDDQIAENITIAESEFWDLVTYGIEPEIDGSDSTETLIAARYPRSAPDKVMKVDTLVAELVVDFTGAKALTKKAVENEKALRSQIVNVLGDAEAAVDEDGVLLLTFKSGADRKTFNAEALKSEMPDVYEQFIKTSAGSRTLLIK